MNKFLVQDTVIVVFETSFLLLLFSVVAKSGAAKSGEVERFIY
jgi:hypothetical protein